MAILEIARLYLGYAGNLQEKVSQTQSWLCCVSYLGILLFSIYQISEQQFLRVLIGYCNLEYPWLFTVLQPKPRWHLISRNFRKTKFEQWMKQSYKQISRKPWTSGCWCLLVSRKLFSCWICNKIIKMHLTKCL